MAKVKLPPLPDLEPQGSMAVYLAQVRQKRADEPPASPLDEKVDVPAHAKASVEQEISSTEELSISSTIVSTDESVSERSNADGGENNASMTPITETPSEQSTGFNKESDLSKILNKSTESSTLSPIALSTMNSDSKLQNATELNPIRRPKNRSELSAKSKLEVVQYINSIPQHYTNSSFSKGEMKIRISEEMADLLRILMGCNTRIDHPKFLAENLVNHFFEEFFTKYASDIEQLGIEQQQQQLLQYQKKLSSFKQKVSS